MYEAHFGLQSRPFGTKAVGPAVFTGPQQAKTVRGLHQGLVAQDAVVTIAGPTGVGKTTIVGKALESIKPNRMAAWIGRMQLSPEELLDLLLAGFGAGKPVQGSIRRFALFRRIMAQRAAAGTAVAVVVEDAKRLGVDTLAELEALTAADTGDSAGANIILMGAPDLAVFLKNPALARLKQRIRRRETVAEFSQTEVSGYLRHCLRQAGGDYDRVFERGVDQIIYRASEGVARVVNTLAENALQAAAEEGLKRVTTGLMHEVASDNYTYEGPLPRFAGETEIDWEAAPTTEAVDEAEAQNDSLIPDEKDLPPAARNIVVESGRYPELPDVAEEKSAAADPDPGPAEKPAARISAEPPAAPAQPDEAAGTEGMRVDDEFEIPELINDTQPELSALPMPKSDEVVSNDVPAPSAAAPRVVPAAAKPAVTPPVTAAAEEDDKFDLDAALTIDVESTNLMEGITPNIEKLAAAAKAAETAAATPAAKSAGRPAADDLPTLSNSMRVNVAREVKRAREIMEAPGATATKANPPTPQPTVKATSGAANPKSAPAAATRPAPRSRPAPKGVATATAKVAPPLARSNSKPVATAPDDEVMPDVLEPEPELLAAMEPSPEPEDTAAPAPAAEPGQSEMTRRIAALEAEKPRRGVDSLEAALESAKKSNQQGLLATPVAPKPKDLLTPTPSAPAPLPEIKLEIELTSTQKRKKEELKKAAAEISRATSIEEFDDKMAETLFGDEDLEAIAAEVIANPPPGYEPVSESRDHEKAAPPPAGPSPVLIDDPIGGSELGLAEEAPAKPSPKTGNGALSGANGGSQGVKAGRPRSPVPPDGPAKSAPAARPARVAPPDSIENQINTSITQRMAALDLSRLGDGLADEVDDKPEKKSGGFFSRFRRSS